MSTAETIVRIVEVYGFAGMAVAALFLTIGIDRVDPSARGSYMFRPLIAPGVVVLWPLVLLRWLALERGATQTAPGKGHITRPMPASGPFWRSFCRWHCLPLW